MLRYCRSCQKEFEFAVKSTKDLENLVCPECGRPIPKNSRRPIDPNEDKIQDDIGNGFYIFFRLLYVFFALCGVLGVAAYLLHWDTALYVVTAVATVLYLMRYRNSELGVLWLTAGAGVGYWYDHSPRGICLGITAALIVRHVIRRVLWGLLFKFIRWINKI